MIISTKNCVEECILYSLAYCDWLILAVFGPCGNSCFVKMINCFCQFVYFRKFLHPIVVLRNFRRLQTFFINGRRFNILLYAYKLAFMTSLSCKKFKRIFTLKRGHEGQLICIQKHIKLAAIYEKGQYNMFCDQSICKLGVYIFIDS